MNYQDWKQRIDAIKTLLGGISVPADERHISIMNQIHYLLSGMRDECDSCIHQEQTAQQEQAPQTTEQ